MSKNRAQTRAIRLLAKQRDISYTAAMREHTAARNGAHAAGRDRPVGAIPVPEASAYLDWARALAEEAREAAVAAWAPMTETQVAILAEEAREAAATAWASMTETQVAWLVEQADGATSLVKQVTDAMDSLGLGEPGRVD